MTNVAWEDTYCYEMLSLVTSLSASAVGRKHLANCSQLIEDLLHLLHIAPTSRLQRQVIPLLRHLLPHIKPEKMAQAMGVTSLPSSRSTEEGVSVAFDVNRHGILDVFLACITKSLSLQVKVSKSNKKLAMLAGQPITMAGSLRYD